MRRYRGNVKKENGEREESETMDRKFSNSYELEKKENRRNVECVSMNREEKERIEEEKREIRKERIERKSVKVMR